jgi:UDP-glucuronate 4-epimerase
VNQLENLRGRRCIVTGAAGFIGAVLCRRLHGLGADTVAVDRQVLDLPVHCVRQDLLGGDLAPLLTDAELVFHLAGRPGVVSSWGSAFGAYLSDNVAGTRAVLDALATSGASRARLVFASSSSVYGPLGPDERPSRESDVCQPSSPYGLTKLAAEQLTELYIRTRGVEAVICRLFTVYGPGQRADMAISRLLDAWASRTSVGLHGDGRLQRHFTYVSDAVDGMLAAAVHGEQGETYNVAGTGVHNLQDVIGELEALVRSSIATEPQPRPLGVPSRTHADLSKARRRLGFRPRVVLAQGLAAQLEAFIVERSQAGPRLPDGRPRSAAPPSRSDSRFSRHSGV